MGKNKRPWNLLTIYNWRFIFHHHTKQVLIQTGEKSLVFSRRYNHICLPTQGGLDCMFLSPIGGLKYKERARSAIFCNISYKSFSIYCFLWFKHGREGINIKSNCAVAPVWRNSEYLYCWEEKHMAKLYCLHNVTEDYANRFYKRDSFRSLGQWVTGFIALYNFLPSQQ